MSEITRSSSDRVLGGVCAGLAKHFGIDVTLVRVGFAIGAFATASTVVVLYAILWALLPEEGKPGTIAADLVGKAKDAYDGRKPSAAPRAAVPQPGTPDFQAQSESLKAEPYPWESDHH